MSLKNFKFISWKLENQLKEKTKVDEMMEESVNLIILTCILLGQQFKWNLELSTLVITRRMSKWKMKTLIRVILIMLQQSKIIKTFWDEAIQIKLITFGTIVFLLSLMYMITKCLMTLG